MTRRGRVWLVVALMLGGVLLAMVALAPVPYVTQSPGPVFDILGQFDGKPVLQIEGARSYPTTGRLDMTTVAEAGGAGSPMQVGAAIVGLIQPNTSVVPDQDSRPEDEAEQVAVFDASKSDALAAAARYLGRPVESEPIIVGVTSGSGADGKLAPEDVLVSVSGERIRHAEQIGPIIRGEPVGTAFQFVVRRGDEKVRETVKSGPNPDDPQQPIVGITVGDHYSSDFDVTVNLAQIGGPSAGLMLAVGMVDKMTPGDLIAGRHVAGTGTIDGEGTVGPIGGIGKKMIAARDAGAELFLAPEGNCAETVGVTPEGLLVAPAGSLPDAIAVIEDWRKGNALPTCSTEGNG